MAAELQGGHPNPGPEGKPRELFASGIETAPSVPTLPEQPGLEEERPEYQSKASELVGAQSAVAASAVGETVLPPVEAPIPVEKTGPVNNAIIERVFADLKNTVEEARQGISNPQNPDDTLTKLATALANLPKEVEEAIRAAA